MSLTPEGDTPDRQYRQWQKGSSPVTRPCRCDRHTHVLGPEAWTTCHTEFVLNSPGSRGATCACELPLSRGKTHLSYLYGRRQFWGLEPGVPPGEAPPPVGTGSQGPVSLAVSIQSDGSQEVRGCKAGKRLLYTCISQRWRKFHSDRFSEERVVVVGKVPPPFGTGRNEDLSFLGFLCICRYNVLDSLGGSWV